MIKELTHFNGESVIDAVLIGKINELVREHNKKIGSDST